jgi:Flp pilus assembly protein CpaB
VPVTTPNQPRQGRESRRLLSTRGGSALVAAVTALLAGALLLVFLTQYRKSVRNSDKTAPVLVAQRLIPHGSSGNVIATQGLYQVSRMKKADLQTGALSDPSAVRGMVAVVDILPGQQLTERDFGPVTNGVQYNLTGDERAISIPLDASHGLIGTVQTGDRVDVIGIYNFSPSPAPIARILLQNILVLSAPPPGAGGGSNVVLQVPDDQAAKVAWSSDNAKLWLVERPQIGAKQTPPAIVTGNNIVLDTKPIPISGKAAQQLLRGR